MFDRCNTFLGEILSCRTSWIGCWREFCFCLHFGQFPSFLPGAVKSQWDNTPSSNCCIHFCKSWALLQLKIIPEPTDFEQMLSGHSGHFRALWISCVSFRVAESLKTWDLWHNLVMKVHIKSFLPWTNILISVLHLNLFTTLNDNMSISTHKFKTLWSWYALISFTFFPSSKTQVCFTLLNHLPLLDLKSLVFRMLPSQWEKKKKS